MKNHRGEAQRKRRPSRLLRQERRRWDDDTKSPLAIGCTNCSERELCGGLHTERKAFSCLDECCNNPSNCTATCPRNLALFVDRVREINGFDLHNIPRVDKLSVAPIPAYAPHLYHGSSRDALLETDVAAIPLHALYSRRDGSLKMLTRAEVAAKFKLHENTKLILVGSDEDPTIEVWWRLAEKRLALIPQLAAHGYELVTAPNYSLFTNQLRYDNMHSMKRIGIVQQEFAAAGMLCALHINARTPRDYERWGNYLRERDEITHVAFEFGTVWRWPLRRAFHLHHLASLPAYVGRPLHLTMIGGVEALRTLAPAYAQITFVDAVPFLKAIKRQRVMEGNDLRLQSHSSPTKRGEPINALLSDNIDVTRKQANLIISEACTERVVGRIAPTPQTPEKTVSAPSAPFSIRDAAPKLLARDLQTETEDRR